MRVRVVVTGFTGAPGFMNFYFASVLGSPDDNKAIDSCQRVQDAFNTTPSIWPAAFHWDISADVDTIDDETGDVTGTQTGTHLFGNGTNGVGFGPLASGGLLRWFTGDRVAGRLIKGRTFFVPIAFATNPDGSLGTGTRLAIDAFGTAMEDGGVSPSVNHVIWRRPRKAGSGKNHNLPARLGSTHDVSGFSTATKMAVLRSRRD